MPIAHYLNLFLPQISILMFGVFALIAAMLRKPRVSLVLALTGSLSSLFLAVRLLGINQTIFEGTYRVGSLSLWACIILPLATIACMLMARDELRNDTREAPAYSLFMFATLGAIILAGAGSLMIVVTGALMSALASFGLVSLRQNNHSTEAAMKYFIYGSVSTAIMIFGMSYWFGITGSTQIADLARLSRLPLAGLVGLIGVVVGIGYKAAIVPVQAWAPDTYQGAPLSVAAYISIVPKIGAIFGLAQIASNLPDMMHWRLLFAVIAAATLIYGTVIALNQTNVVRLLAYSSIAQSGYLLLGVTTLGRTNLAIQSLIIFSAAYAAMNIGAFAVAAKVGVKLSHYNRLAKSQPWLAAAMAVFLLSLTGIPPLFGFIGKLLLLSAAIAGGFLWLSVIAIIVSVLSLAVYLRVVAPMYSRDPHSASKASTRPMLLTKLVIIVCLLVTSGLGFAAQTLIGNIK
jgi:proton-translocating NADH-quinone oxidoreductase chain N